MVKQLLFLNSDFERSCRRLKLSQTRGTAVCRLSLMTMLVCVQYLIHLVSKPVQGNNTCYNVCLKVSIEPSCYWGLNRQPSIYDSGKTKNKNQIISFHLNCIMYIAHTREYIFTCTFNIFARVNLKIAKTFHIKNFKTLTRVLFACATFTFTSVIFTMSPVLSLKYEVW